MKSEIISSRSVKTFDYRNIRFEVVVPDDEDPGVIIWNRTGEYGRKYFCAYFYLHTRKLNIKFDVGKESKLSPGSFDGQPNFMGLDSIQEISNVCHWYLSFGEWSAIAGQDFEKNGRIKLGVDYNHLDDEYMGHTLESVCRDCEVVIDKIHELGLLKEEEC